MVALMGQAGQAGAHDTKVLPNTDGAAASGTSNTPLPLPLGGRFTLTDQFGRQRTEVDPAGAMQLVFFGYASCRDICSVAFSQMAEVEQALVDRGIALTPVMITVDPLRDTPAALQSALARFSANFVGLTGNSAALDQAYRAFSIASSVVFVDPKYGSVYTHGSFLYLLDANGQFLTLIPPILSNDRVVDMIASYAAHG